jgi:hypothetical protein
MTEDRWFQLRAREHAIVLDALASMLNADPANKAEIESLALSSRRPNRIRTLR